MKHTAFSLVFAASFYFADLAPAQACSCVESAGVSEDLAASGSVFEGKVTRLHHEPKQHRLTATLRVLRRWKGERRTTVDVVTIDQGSLCGFGFRTREIVLALHCRSRRHVERELVQPQQGE